jgi:CMP-N,N'-diacetyllegionaminic acid synthase
MKILCLIPARSGSKSLPHKNIKDVNGIPLMAHSIIQALNSKHKMRIIVSTDSKEYADIANKYGAETPFLRPEEISQDDSTDYQFIKHAVEWLKDNENYYPDIILQLRPTQPDRKVSDIDKCLDIFIEKYNDIDSLRTVVEVEKTPYKMYTIDCNKSIPKLNPMFNKYNGNIEPYNMGRQYLPKSYLHNGYIDILKPNLLDKGMISGHHIYPYVMNKDDTIDIDTINDFNKYLKL